MKTAVAALLTAALCSTSALAGNKPFKLTLINDSDKYNGSVLDACHNGASFEALCASKYNATTDNSKYNATEDAYITFRFNESAIYTGNKKYGHPGSLIWRFPTSDDGTTIYEQETASLITEISTNVAMMELGPSSSDQQLVAFDPEDLMNLQSYYDDTVTPPTISTLTGYYRWYICETNYEGYLYDTLNFVYGKAKPENPSCIATQVKRVYWE